MKILNKIALVLGWLDIIGIVIGGGYLLIVYALSLAYVILPIAVVILIIALLVRKKK